MSELLEVAGLESGYGRSKVLFGVNMKARAKGGVAILGRNGAGKTTLLKTLIGELKPMAGEILFGGQEASGEETEARVRRGMGYVPQDHAVFAKLTVRENLLLGAVAQKDQSIYMVLDFFPKLGQRLG